MGGTCVGDEAHQRPQAQSSVSGSPPLRYPDTGDVLVRTNNHTVTAYINNPGLFPSSGEGGNRLPARLGPASSDLAVEHTAPIRHTQQLFICFRDGMAVQEAPFQLVV